MLSRLSADAGVQIVATLICALLFAGVAVWLIRERERELRRAAAADAVQLPRSPATAVIATGAQDVHGCPRMCLDRVAISWPYYLLRIASHRIRLAQSQRQICMLSLLTFAGVTLCLHCCRLRQGMATVWAPPAARHRSQLPSDPITASLEGLARRQSSAHRRPAVPAPTKATRSRRQYRRCTLICLGTDHADECDA